MEATGRKRTRSGSDTRQRGGIVPFRVTAEERAELEAAAERAGLSLGSYIRRCVLVAPKTRSTRRPTVERELAAQAIAQLGRIGGSLYQIARRLNFGDVTERGEDLPRLMAELREAKALLMQALGRGSA